MRRAFISLLLIAGMLGMFGLGNTYGATNSDKAWSARVEETTSLLKIGTYRMAWTNVRACVLAIDSSVMRFLSSPDPEHYKEIGTRYAACEQHWELLSKYSPEDPKEYRTIDEARWMFNNWADQIYFMIKLQVTILTAINAGHEEQAQEMYKSLIKEREESRKFRDYIENELFKAW